jgi:hypothetical protein
MPPLRRTIIVVELDDGSAIDCVFVVDGLVVRMGFGREVPARLERYCWQGTGDGGTGLSNKTNQANKLRACWNWFLYAVLLLLLEDRIRRTGQMLVETTNIAVNNNHPALWRCWRCGRSATVPPQRRVAPTLEYRVSSPVLLHTLLYHQERAIASSSLLFSGTSCHYHNTNRSQA